MSALVQVQHYLQLISLFTLAICVGQAVAADRDHATAAAIALCVANGANIIRAHNVRAAADAAKVADAMCTKGHRRHCSQ